MPSSLGGLDHPKILRTCLDGDMSGTCDIMCDYNQRDCLTLGESHVDGTSCFSYIEATCISF